MNIIDEIVEARKRGIARLGPSMGHSLPPRRTVPLIPFGRLQPGRDFFIVSEVKRGSPSRGIFAAETDAVRQAEHYVDREIKTLSVLTEETYFHGSLEDLYRIKSSFPDLCVMRKDFISSIGISNLVAQSKNTILSSCSLVLMITPAAFI